MALSAPSQTAIVNAAAAALGSTARVSAIFEETTPLARHAAAHWDAMVRHLAAEHPFNAFIARVLVDASTEAPAFGFAHQFALPADCLRWLPAGIEDDDWFEAVQEGDWLLSDEAGPVAVRYLSADRAEAIHRWPPHLVTAATYALAARLAEPLTQSEGVETKMMEAAEMWLRKAKRADALATGTRGRNRISRGSDWLSARNRPYQYNGR